MKTIKFLMACVLGASFFLAGCAADNATPTPTQPPPTATITSTPDPCSPDHIEDEVYKVHKFMREFDDASALAANVGRDQLNDSIATLQRIRRDAEDQEVPSCLVQLKTYQIAHMNTTINTLLAFMGGADQESVNSGIALARQQHDAYSLELARLLKLDIIPVNTVTVAPEVTETVTP
jgi:hypothetical protein